MRSIDELLEGLKNTDIGKKAVFKNATYHIKYDIVVVIVPKKVNKVFIPKNIKATADNFIDYLELDNINKNRLYFNNKEGQTVIEYKIRYKENNK